MVKVLVLINRKRYVLRGLSPFVVSLKVCREKRENERENREKRENREDVEKTMETLKKTRKTFC